MIHSNVARLIGRTPIVRLAGISPDPRIDILAKLEMLNPSGSVKDRAALGMILQAEKDGILDEGGCLVEPTSGNTGISLAMIAASRGYRFTAMMPESMSAERQRIMGHLGAELVLTPASEGMQGAIDEAQRLVQSEGFVMLSQFTNPANPDIHRRTTAREILTDTAGGIDCFLAGVGTGGTFTGVGSVLEKEIPGIHLVAVEPAASAVLSGRSAGKHGIQGIGAGFIPAVTDTSLIDEIITVADDDAVMMARRLAAEEGLMVGISSGAAVSAACRLARRVAAEGRLNDADGYTVLTVLPDSAERYLSILGD